MMLVWKKMNIEKKLSQCYSIVYYYNGAQRYKQFLQVGQLYRDLILLFVSLCLSGASVSSVFMVLYTEWCILKNLAYIFLFTFSELSLVGLALDVVV